MRGTRPIAFYFGALVSGYGTGLRAGFDHRFGPLSPGFLLLTEVLRTSIEHGSIQQVNLMGSSHAYKHRLANRADSTYQLIVCAPSWRCRLLHWLQQATGKHHLSMREYLARTD